MNKILVLATEYPTFDNPHGFTPVVHYFTKEWVKMGHEVIVVHNLVIYPNIFYLVARFFKETIESLTGSNFSTLRETDDKIYFHDGVKVLRLPIFKLFPKYSFSKKVIEFQLSKIIQFCSEFHFTPDIIIGHFTNPQLELVHDLSKIYSSKTCMVMHDNGRSIKSIYKKKYKAYFESIDIWGFRSKSIQSDFEFTFGERKKKFICYSGIPDNASLSINNRKFPSKLKNFIYVGSLIKRKYPITVLESLNELYSTEIYNLLYIGTGAEEKNIRNLIVKKNIVSKSISFMGFLDRDKIMNYLDKSECFVMISKGEAFGLVYLEAMARGLITIGSKREGIDGVIVHGVNGFLCSSGDKNELVEIFKHINSLSSDEKKLVSDNAIKTAQEMTDFNVADKYLRTIQNFNKLN